MYRHMTTDELKEHHIHTQIESKDESEQGNSGEDEYIQNHLLRSPNIVERLEQIVVEDNVLYEIRDIPDPLLEAFDYPDDESSSPNNDTELMPSDSEDEAQEPTWTPEPGPL